MTIKIRNSDQSDLIEIQRIYAHYVSNALASFELVPPDINEIERRWQSVCEKGFPYLVADIDGSVGGFAYAAPYRARPAYRSTVENSVYVSPDHLGNGLGQMLLLELIEACTKIGLRQMIAVIGGSDNFPSINLHKKCGFTQVGTLPSTGYKFDQWVDSVLMQRELGDGDKSPPTSSE